MAVRAGDERRLRAGVVGAGHMGQYHVLAYAELWDIDLVGVVDVDRERAKQVAAYYDTQVLSDHHELIGKVDLASVAVPTEQHFQVASDLLEAGVGVLVEKPITPTLEEARELFAIARRTGAVLHVGHVERFNGESIRYRRASFVEHVQVHKDNPLKLEVLNLARAVRRSRAGEQVVLAETEDVRSLAMALEIERMIREGRCESAYSTDPPWSAPSA